MPAILQPFGPYVVLKSATALDRLNLMTLWTSPLTDDAGATTSVPAAPKFNPVRSVPTGLLDEPVARNASAEVVPVYVTSARATKQITSNANLRNTFQRFMTFFYIAKSRNRQARSSSGPICSVREPEQRSISIQDDSKR